MSERRRAEQIVDQEPINRRIRMMLDAMPARVWFLDAEHRTLYANREAAKFFRRPPEALVGVATIELLSEASFRADLPMRERALAGEVAKWEGWSRYADGVERYTERIFHPHYEADGVVTGYYEFVRDVTEWKRAEAEKLRSERLLKDAIDSLSDGFAVMNPQGVLVACNAAYAEIYALAPDELLGRGFRDRIERFFKRLRVVDGAPFDGDDPEAVERFDTLRLTKESPVEMGLSDGRQFSARRTTTHDGGRVLLLSDITELKRREAELDEARALLQEAVSTLAVGFAIYDAENRIVMCNERYRAFNPEICELLAPGAEFGALLREGWRRGQYPDEPDPEAFVARRLEELRHPGASPLVRQAGDRWYRIWYQRIRDGGLVLTQTDVTETRRMEDALRKSEELVRQVLEACPYPISMNRAEDSVVIYETPAALELFGEAESRHGRPALDRWLKAKYRARYLRLLRARGAVDEMEIRFRRPSGEVFWAAISGRLIRYRDEEVIVSCVRDLTERRASEAELDRQREALHQAEKLGALGELLAGVSHELNNPLSVLVGQAAMLSEEASDASSLARSQKIAAAADRCARIVKSFLAMARQQPGALAPTDVNELILEALEDCGGGLRAAGVEVRLDLAEPSATIPGDAAQLRQVLVNLVQNARQAMEDSAAPKVMLISSRIETREEGDALAIDVADTGPGVPEALRNRVFEPLFTTKPVGAGTGIGLALCHRIVAAHGGRIRVDAAPEGGALFMLRLPMTARTTSSEIAGERPPGLCVLLVDDDPDVLEIVADVLERRGHRVEAVGSAAAALDRLGLRGYDAVISDIRMPDMDGPAFFEALARRRPDMVHRLGFMTGDAMSGAVGAFLARCGRPHIEKPLTPDDLRRLLAALSPEPQAEAEP